MQWSTGYFLIHSVPALYFRCVYVAAAFDGKEALAWSLLSDLLTTALYALLTGSLAVRLRRGGVAVFFTLCWWFYHATVSSYFQAMHALPVLEQARYLVDPHFLAATFSAASVAVLVAAALLLGALARLLYRRLAPRKRMLWAVPLLCAALFAPSPLRVNGSPLVVQLWSWLASSREEALLQSTLTLAHDLAGAPLAPLPAKRPNVLMIVLEGIPGGYVPQNVEFTRASADFAMPLLGRWASRSLLVPNFVTHRNQTINGLYSLLCASYPRLFDGTLVVQELLAVPPQNPFMPAILARNGYRTTYLQAAELRFMDKDRFMKLAGFQEVLGEEWFRRDGGVFFSRWGINDLDFFRQSLKKVRELRSGKEPWFLTLLTVGTHHPYTLPPGWKKEGSLPEKLRSVRFLDEALNEFLTRLRQDGALKDTLVLITSDESHGMNSDVLLAGNWGLCMALLPPNPKALTVNPGLFGLVDLPLSVLDYVGLSASADWVAGRSIFRDYPVATPRALAGSWGSRLFVASGDVLLLKDFGSDAFVKHDLAGSPFAVSSRAEGEPYGIGKSVLRAASRLSEKPRTHASYAILPADSTFDVPQNRPDNTQTWLSGGQYLQLQKGERFALTLEAHAPTENKSPVWLDFMFYRLDGTFLPFVSNGLLQMPFLAPGETVRLALTLEVRESFMLDSIRLAAWSDGAPRRLTVRELSFRQLAEKNAPRDERVLYDKPDARIALDAFFLTTARGVGIPYTFSEGSVYGQDFLFIPASPDVRDLSPSALPQEGFDAEGRTLASRAAVYFHPGGARNGKDGKFTLHLELRPDPMPEASGDRKLQLLLNGRTLDTLSAVPVKRVYPLTSADVFGSWNVLELRNPTPLEPFQDDTEFADWPRVRLKEMRLRRR